MPEIGKDERWTVHFLDMEPILHLPNHIASRRPGRGRRELHSSLQDFDSRSFSLSSFIKINAFEKNESFENVLMYRIREREGERKESEWRRRNAKVKHVHSPMNQRG